MQNEYEIRRSGSLTIELLQRLQTLQPVETHFIIYWNNFRVYINNNPHIERKTLLNTRPILFNWITLEICYESIEEPVSILLLYDIIKNGYLMKKTIIIKTEGLVLYMLENLEVNLSGLQNKCVIELENPNSAKDYIKELYLQIAVIYNLNIDDKYISNSVENVLHNPSCSSVNKVKYPKVDGERGLITFYDNYEVFTSNTNSFLIEPPLYKEWGKEYNFYLKNIVLVAEQTSTHLIIIDLALSKYFKADTRIEFIEHLARRIRKKLSVESGILFQSFDIDYIKLNVKTDGNIYITNNKLYKEKYLPTVDLKYISNEMIDRNGICYKLICENHDLINNTIYECILDRDQQIVDIIRTRHDKFFPNSRKTILCIFKSLSH